MPSGRSDGFESVAELVHELRHALALRDSEVERGQLAGLTSREEPAPLRRGSTVSDVFRGGVLAGRLYRRLLEDGRRLDGPTMLAAAAYGASVAQGAAVGAFEAPDADALLKEHTVACVRASRRGHDLDEERERAALEWLADELGIPLGDALLVRWRDLRGRRLARLAED